MGNDIHYVSAASNVKLSASTTLTIRKGSFSYRAAINPRIPTMPTAAPETTVGIAPPAEDDELLTVLLAALAALEALLTAVLKIDVTPEMTSVVKEETTLPAPVDVGVVVVVVTTPLIEVLVIVVELLGPVSDGERNVVMVLPAELVVVTAVAVERTGPPGEARKALIFDSRAAIWVDQALGIAEENQPGTLFDKRAS